MATPRATVLASVMATAFGKGNDKGKGKGMLESGWSESSETETEPTVERVIENHKGLCTVLENGAQVFEFRVLSPSHFSSDDDTAPPPTTARQLRRAACLHALCGGRGRGHNATVFKAQRRA